MRNRSNSESIPYYSNNGNEGTLGIRPILTRIEDFKPQISRISKEKLYLNELLNITPPTSPSPLIGTRKFIKPSTSSIKSNNSSIVKSKSTPTKFFNNLKSSLTRSNSKSNKSIEFIVEPPSSSSSSSSALPLEKDKFNVLIPRLEISNPNYNLKDERFKDLNSFLRGEESFSKTSSSNSCSSSANNTKDSSPISSTKVKKRPNRIPVPIDYPFSVNSIDGEGEVTTPSSLAFLLDTGEYYESPSSSSSSSSNSSCFNIRSDSLPSTPSLLNSPFSSNFSSSSSLVKKVPFTPPPFTPTTPRSDQFSSNFNFSQKGKSCSIITASSSNESFHSIPLTSLTTSSSSARILNLSSPNSNSSSNSNKRTSNEKLNHLLNELHSLITEINKQEGLKLIKKLSSTTNSSSGKDLDLVEIEILESIEMLRNLQKDLNGLIDSFIDRLIEDGKRFDD